MSTPFATSFAYEYLCKLGIDDNDALDIAQENLPAINKFLEDAISVIGDRLDSRKSNITCLDSKRRFDLYTLISNHFFHYAYVRCWEFKPSLETFPVGIDRTIFETGCDFSQCLVKFYPEASQQDPQFLRDLDIQARQWIYVYCFENGINLGFY